MQLQMLLANMLDGNTLRYVDMSWKDFIDSESKKDYFKKLSDFLVEDSKSYIIYPRHAEVLNAFKYCPLNNVKVVILGQDPYHGPDQAHGLSFSVPNGQTMPPSLRNIFLEIKNDLGWKEPNKFTNLTPWTRQGVLLLNSVLTVRHGDPASHKNKGWEQFTDSAIKLVSEQTQPIVFMLWGSFAKNKKNLITNPNHLVLEAAHPSPFSAHNGFFGCKHFSRANEFITNHGGSPIDWSTA